MKEITEASASVGLLLATAVILTTVNDMIGHNTNSSRANVSGRVSFNASPETIQANGKTLQKLETVLAYR